MRKTGKYKAAFWFLATMFSLVVVYTLVFAAYHGVEGDYKLAFGGLAGAAVAAGYMVRNARSARRISDSETAEALRRLRDAANREAGGSRH